MKEETWVDDVAYWVVPVAVIVVLSLLYVVVR